MTDETARVDDSKGAVFVRRAREAAHGCLYCPVSFPGDGFERTQKTLFLLNSALFVALLFLHWLDHWDFLDRRPVRTYALLVAIVLLGLRLSRYWAGLELSALVVPVLVRGYIAWCLKRRAAGLPCAAGALLVAMLSWSLVSAQQARERQVWRADAPGGDTTRYEPVSSSEWPAAASAAGATTTEPPGPPWCWSLPSANARPGTRTTHGSGPGSG